MSLATFLSLHLVYFAFICRSFLKAVLFVSYKQYVNTARIDPALLSVENSRLRIASTKNLAICLMTGTVTESFITAPCESGPRSSPYNIHKVTIAPLEQDLRRDMSVWGLLFGFHVIAGAMSHLGLSFATRGEGRGDSWKTGKYAIRFKFCSDCIFSGSAPVSPSKPKGSVLKAIASPLAGLTAEFSYTASRSFDDHSACFF